MLEYIFDGAFGTYAFSLNDKLVVPEIANITEPGLTSEIHEEYIEAGATAVRTNTFGANDENFSRGECEEIIRAGYGIARAAAKGKNVDVFADIGPIGREDADDGYLRVVRTFIEAGAENFIFETQNEAGPLGKAIDDVKEKVPGGRVIVSFGVGRDGFSKSGKHIVRLLDEAVALGADYVGLNCVCGPTHIFNLLKNIDAGRYGLSVMPNSGYPEEISGRLSFVIDNPEYFADKMMNIRSLGVKIVGACCGSTPKHIKTLCDRIKRDGARAAAKPRNEIKTGRPGGAKKPDVAEKFIAVEIDSPIDANIGQVLDSARKIKDCGADFITIPDSPLGKSRANSMMISSIVKNHAGIEVIPHLSCRDRNRVAIKGDLIAANISGISNVLAITGDPAKRGVQSDDKGVFGMNSFKLISFIKSLNELIFTDNPFYVCGALNITADNFDMELARARKKIENGVDCLFTQPIFSRSHLDNYFTARKSLDCKIAVGIMPPVSYKNAVFLNNEIPGISIPDEVIGRLKEAGADSVKSICLEYCESIIDEIGGRYDGYYIMTQLNKIEFAIELARYIKTGGRFF
jgi:homocysteine S-methyltransferase